MYTNKWILFISDINDHLIDPWPHEITGQIFEDGIRLSSPTAIKTSDELITTSII